MTNSNTENLTSATPSPTPAENHESITATIVEPKLWAGKYKSPEDLEEAYKNTAKIYQDNQELKKQVEKLSVVPDDYTVPSELGLRQADINEIKAIAKASGLNQDQFIKTAQEMQTRIVKQNEVFEESKKALGEDKLTLINDYVSKNIPKHLHDVVLNKLIRSKDALDEALEHRSKLLNSEAPGMSQAGGNVPEKYDGATELRKAAEECHKDPGNMQKRNKYIELAREVGEARGLGRKD